MRKAGQTNSANLNRISSGIDKLEKTMKMMLDMRSGMSYSYKSKHESLEKKLAEN